MNTSKSVHDSFGEGGIPNDAYWGIHTQHALENFNVSPYRIPKSLICSLALIKRAAAETNEELGLLDRERASAVREAAREVGEGRFDRHFPVDVFQTGSGTSWNMNMNEVIARRAGELIGGAKKAGDVGEKGTIHPNDTVNLGQSSNDVIPSAMLIAFRLEGERLLTQLKLLASAFEKKEREFADVMKLGRTHLQDAVPMTAAQEISGWRSQIEAGIDRLRGRLEECEALPLGGTALGTGLNSSSVFAEGTIARIAEETKFPFRGCRNRFAGISSRDESLALMGSLNEAAAALMKISQDLRLLSSGPRGGFGEIRLPALQAGSSIMPGKVNPVIPEMVIQAAAFVTGKYVSVTVAAQNGPLQLNIMQPLIAHELLSAIDILTRTAERLREKAVEGMEYKRRCCRRRLDESLALVTPLARKIGYDRAAAIARRAYEEERELFLVALEESGLSEDELKRLLDPGTMIGPF